MPALELRMNVFRLMGNARSPDVWDAAADAVVFIGLLLSMVLEEIAFVLSLIHSNRCIYLIGGRTWWTSIASLIRA